MFKTLRITWRLHATADLCASASYAVAALNALHAKTASEQMSPAKTAAQRQAERKARELAAGRVQWKRWVHPDDVPAMAAYADKLARKRQKACTGSQNEPQ